MKVLVIVAVIIGAALARPQDKFNQNEEQQQAQQYNNRPRYETTTYIPIIRFDKEQGNDGSYRALWETGNNILAQEEGFVKDLGPNPDEKGQNLLAQVQQGSYTYTSPEGQIISVTYTADENGFHPSGDHLPQAPTPSPEVQKGLDLIYEGIRKQQEIAAREEQQGVRRENQYQEQQ